MKLRAVIETACHICDNCILFPECAECFEANLEGRGDDPFLNAKLIKVEKVKNGK